MTEMGPDKPGPLLRHPAHLHAALREEIMREIADLQEADLRGVLRMIEVWKGRAAQSHVNETQKSEHEAAVMLTPATEGGDA